MTYVIRKDTHLLENGDTGLGPWRGCINIKDGKPWYATNLARPTQFVTRKEAEDELERLKENYEGRFRIAVYEELFQEKIKPVLPLPLPPQTPPAKTLPSDWNW